MQCLNCGNADLPTESKYCQKCGARLQNILPKIERQRSISSASNCKSGKRKTRVKVTRPFTVHAGDRRLPRGRNLGPLSTYKHASAVETYPHTFNTLNPLPPIPKTEGPIKPEAGNEVRTFSAEPVLGQKTEKLSPIRHDRVSTHDDDSDLKEGDSWTSDSGNDDKDEFLEEYTRRNDIQQTTLKDKNSDGETLRGREDFEKDDFDDHETGSTDGIINGHKDVKQSENTTDRAQVASADLKHAGEDRQKGRKKADKAKEKRGNISLITQGVTAKSHLDANSEKETGNKATQAEGNADSDTKAHQTILKVSKKGAALSERVNSSTPARLKKDTAASRESIKDEKSRITGNQPMKKPSVHISSIKPEDGVTVVFHVFLASDVSMEGERLCLRAREEDLGSFRVNCVEMEPTRSPTVKDKSKLTGFIGRCVLSVSRARQGTGYKYVKIKRGEELWERLVDLPNVSRGIGQVNRFLHIPEKYQTPGAIWHQFDGVSYIYPQERESFWNKFKEFPNSGDINENRKSALLASLPKWKGFLVGQAGEEMKATDAIVKLKKVVRCMTHVWIEITSRPEMRKFPIAWIREALSDLLATKIEKSDEILARSDVQLEARISALVSSMAILLICEYYEIPLRKRNELSILSCLSLEADPTEQRCTMYEVVLEEFSEKLRSNAIVAIENLCNRHMVEHQWLLAVPLLHFLRGDIKPFEEPEIEESYNKPEWFGAQKLEVEKFHPPDEMTFSDFWCRLTSGFEVDLLLKRTFLHIISLWDKIVWEKIVNSKVFVVSDICVALVTKFGGEELPADKGTDEPWCIKSMNILLKESTCKNIQEHEFTISISLQLVEICLKKLSFWNQMYIICQVIELLFTSICKRRQDIGKSPDKEKRQSSESRTINYLLEILKHRLRKDLNQTMSRKRDALARELLLWSDLLWLDEGNRFPTYRKFLITEMTGRARRLEGVSLVKIVCTVDMDTYDTAIGEAFTSLAFEAVEKVTNSKDEGVDEDVFNTICNSYTHGGSKEGEKYGKLLSALLRKSWPKEREQADMSGLDLCTVQFLLTWKPMTGFLEFFCNYRSFCTNFVFP